MNARIAVAETLSHILSIDLTPEFYSGVDLFLIQLFMRGYKVVELEKEDVEEE